MFLEISLLFATSGSGWQSLSRPWQFPRRESSSPASAQPPPTVSYHPGSLAAGSWLLLSRSGALFSKPCHFFSCVWEDKSQNAASPGPSLPAQLTYFLRFRVDLRIFCSFPLSLAQLHSGYVPPSLLAQIRLPTLPPHL